MQVYRQYGEGGRIVFDEAEIEIMYHVLSWLCDCATNEKNKEVIERVVHKLGQELNLSGTLQ